MVVTGKLLTDASFFALVSLFEWSCVWGGFFCTVSGFMLVKSILGCLIDRWVRAWTLVFQVQGSHPSPQRGQAPRTSYESHSKAKQSWDFVFTYLRKAAQPGVGKTSFPLSLGCGSLMCRSVVASCWLAVTRVWPVAGSSRRSSWWCVYSLHFH